MFAGFVDDASVELVGVEAAGAASLGTGRTAVLHGARSSVLADEDGQIVDAHSISAGLDYPGVGPEHAWLRDTGRARYVPTTDEEALEAFRRLAATEGIIPALEPAHALARVDELDAELVLVCLSGRGDKDLAEVLQLSTRLPPDEMRKALVIYLMSEPETPELAEAAVEGGADLVELGFPFSDPLADGPVIRRAAERRSRVGCARVPASSASRDVRERVGDTPLVPMTYSSLLEAYGWERFEADARDAGATSLIVADLPAGDRPELRRVQLVAPTSTDERIALAARQTDGWLYLVTVAGTTGVADELSHDARRPGRRVHAAPVPACRCTRASGSRRRSRPAPRPSSRTASSSARAPCSRPRRAPERSAISSAPCGTRSTLSSARPPGGPRRPGVGRRGRSYCRRLRDGDSRVREAAAGRVRGRVRDGRATRSRSRPGPGCRTRDSPTSRARRRRGRPSPPRAPCGSRTSPS